MNWFETISHCNRTAFWGDYTGNICIMLWNWISRSTTIFTILRVCTNTWLCLMSSEELCTSRGVVIPHAKRVQASYIYGFNRSGGFIEWRWEEDDASRLKDDGQCDPSRHGCWLRWTIEIKYTMELQTMWCQWQSCFPIYFHIRMLKRTHY